MGDGSDCSTRNSNENGTFKLSILFRYLSLIHGVRDQGTWVLMPSDGHMGVLRDVSSGTEVALNMATIALGPVAAGKNKLRRCKRLPSLTDFRTGTWSPRADLLEPSDGIAHSDLSLRMFLPAGEITAYPPAGFPEHAETETETRPGVTKRLTDTILYTVDLSPGTYSLKVKSPRVNVQFIFDSEARFEIRNDDLRRGNRPNRNDKREINALFALVRSTDGESSDESQGPLTDDIWPCPTASTGEFVEQ